MAQKTNSRPSLQKVQELLVKGLSTLTILANQLLKDNDNNTTTDTAVILQNLMNGIALLGSVNWNI